MPIFDSKNYEFIDTINKDPQIEKFMFEDGFSSLTNDLKKIKLCLVEYKDGYIVFYYVGNGDWVCHIAFLRSGRKKSHLFAKECADFMFRNKSCLRLLGEVPPKYFHTKRVLEKIGFKDTGIEKDGYLGLKRIYELTYGDWKCHQKI